MKYTTDTVVTHHTKGTGTQNQGCKTPEHHLGEAEAITSHLHQDTTTPDTRTLRWQIKPTHLMAPHQIPM